jgi:hypothetical protein
MATPRKLASQKTRGTTDKERAIEIACKRISFKAIEILEKALMDESVDIRWKLSAAKEILDRGWGRPAQSVKAEVVISGVDTLVDILKSR